MESDQENNNPFYRNSNIKSHIFKIGFSIRHSQEILFRSKFKKKIETYIQVLQGNSGQNLCKEILMFFFF